MRECREDDRGLLGHHAGVEFPLAALIITAAGLREPHQLGISARSAGIRSSKRSMIASGPRTSGGFSP